MPKLKPFSQQPPGKPKKPSRSLRGITPLLNENLIKDALAKPATLETGHDIRTAAVYAVLTAFDRQVERDFMIELLSATFNMNEHLQRFALMQVLIDSLGSRDPITPEKMFEMRDRLLANAEAWRVKIFNDMTKIAAMAHEEDTIN